MRVTPGIQLLSTAGRNQSRNDCRQNRLGMLPPDQVEQFERFVGEVEHMSAIGIKAIRGGGEDHLGQAGRGGASANCGQQRALCPRAMADERPESEPKLRCREFLSTGIERTTLML